MKPLILCQTNMPAILKKVSSKNYPGRMLTGRALISYPSHNLLVLYRKSNEKSAFLSYLPHYFIFCFTARRGYRSHFPVPSRPPPPFYFPRGCYYRLSSPHPTPYLNFTENDDSLIFKYLSADTEENEEPKKVKKSSFNCISWRYCWLLLSSSPANLQIYLTCPCLAWLFIVT